MHSNSVGKSDAYVSPIAEVSLKNSQQPVLRLQTRGHGKLGRYPIVFLHGWGNDSACWEPLLDYFGPDTEVQLLDLPGFGINGTAEISDLNTFYSEAESVLPPKFHLVGWSLGGMLSVQLAKRFPEKVASLCTIAANVRFVAADDWPAATTSEIYQNFLSGFATEPNATLKRFSFLQAQGDTQRKRLSRFLNQNSPELNQENSGAWLRGLEWLSEVDNRDAFSELTMPYNAIFGEHDALVPQAAYKSFEEKQLATEVHVVADAGHAPHISQAAYVARKLKRFISITENPYQCDKKLVAKSFSSAANQYEKVALMQAKVAKQLVALKGGFSGEICDIGCGTGFCMDNIRPQNTNIVGVDIAHGMLKFCQQKYQQYPPRLVCADFENLPIKENTFDGIVSSLSIQWSENFDQLLQQIKDCLKPGAWCAFSTLGPQTLYELRDAWKQADSFVHVNQFLSHDAVADKLRSTGFTINKTEQSKEVLQYDTVFSLMRDLKAIGAHNVNAGKKDGLTTRKSFQNMANAYETFRCDKKLPATYDVQYFYVTKPYA
ncbi:MAG: malonyl-ACP O-methyltransferase BioC [Agarilytica sp.]